MTYFAPFNFDCRKQKYVSQLKTIQMDNVLKKHLESVTVLEYQKQRAQIIEQCKITPQIFLNWKNGLTEVPELAKPVINEISGKQVYEV